VRRILPRELEVRYSFELQLEKATNSFNPQQFQPGNPMTEKLPTKPPVSLT
jgi:hypothetical protein